jgi:hypothetical protein
VTRIGVPYLCRIVAVSALFCAAFSATADEVERTVLFRDGTVLRVPMPSEPLPWRRVSPVGEVINEPLPYADVAQLTLVTTPATEQVASVRRTVAALGDPDFDKRVAAQQELVDRGAKFLAILEGSLKVTEDFEARWRLKEVLDVLPADKASIQADYDILKTTGGEEIQGDVGDWSIDVPYRGGKITLNRANVRALHTAPLKFSLTAEPPVAIVDRIAEDRDELFPKDVQRIDFEHGPQGQSLKDGQDLRQTFVPQGVTLSCSLPGSFVSVEQYTVHGRSQGQCAAPSALRGFLDRARFHRRHGAGGLRRPRAPHRHNQDRPPRERLPGRAQQHADRLDQDCAGH